MHLEALSPKGKEIFSRLKHFKNFYLAGGTALALQIGHRISVDFDLFSEKEIPKTLLQKVKEILLDKQVNPSVNNSDELTLFVHGTKVTFLYYPFPVVKLYIKYKGVLLLSPKELAATKAYTIGRRGTFKDYVDLYYLLHENHTALYEIIRLAERKYKHAFNGRLFLEQLIYLDDILDADIIFLKKTVTKKQVKIFFETQTKKAKLI